MSSPSLRPRLTKADPDFKEAVASGLKQYRNGDNPERRTLSDTELATRLGVSKPALSNYLRGRLSIGGETLARLFVELGITITYRGKLISARDFTLQRPRTSEPVAQQISFVFDRPCLLEETVERVAITVERREPQESQITVELKVAG